MQQVLSTIVIASISLFSAYAIKSNWPYQTMPVAEAMRHAMGTPAPQVEKQVVADQSVTPH